MRIAIVDDDENVIEFMENILVEADFGCTSFRTGASFLAALRRSTFDLILLDWNLPDLTGLDLLRSLRETMSATTAVIMLTSRSGKNDITTALHAGADDYIVKPESAEIIIARIKAVLRRAMPTESTGREERFGRYLFDRLTETVSVDGNPVQLNAKEFRLALTLFENPNRALARSYLLEKVWQSAGDLPTRTLDMHVSRIRSKLKLNAANGYRIVAITGYGYRFETFGSETI